MFGEDASAGLVAMAVAMLEKIVAAFWSIECEVKNTRYPSAAACFMILTANVEPCDVSTKQVVFVKLRPSLG